MKSQKSFEREDQGKLYLVPTPIGNLEDMTFRGVTTLQEVDFIAAEDTRHTLKLLNHFDITTPLISYHEHNKEGRIPELVGLLKEGKSIAQVSDAGTPSISDPGFELVEACVKSLIPVVPLPGANAATTALIASGLNPQPFYFYGFLSQNKKDRQAALDQLKTFPQTFILYESPHRLKQMLKDAQSILGGDRKLVMARELSKKHEEILRGTVDQALAWCQDHEVRGEFCLVFEGNGDMEAPTPGQTVYISYADHVRALMDEEGMTNKEAIKEVAKLHKVTKRFVYNEFHDL